MSSSSMYSTSPRPAKCWPSKRCSAAKANGAMRTALIKKICLTRFTELLALLFPLGEQLGHRFAGEQLLSRLVRAADFVEHAATRVPLEWLGRSFLVVFLQRRLPRRLRIRQRLVVRVLEEHRRLEQLGQLVVDLHD